MTQTNAVPISEEELLASIRKQVEYYFSKENLQQDTYLTSLMDANMSVPLSVIMKVLIIITSFYLFFMNCERCI